MKKLQFFKAIVMLTMFLSTASLLDAQAPAPDMECKRPEYSPRKEHHWNCKDFLGRRQGIWKSYTYYGYLLSEMTYKDNKVNGPVVIYYATTGKLRERSNFFDGKRDGEYSVYFFSGQPMAEGEYDYGKKIGKWTYYYNSTGEIRLAGSYTSGKREGEWKYYNPKGILTKVVTYKAGETISTTSPAKTTLADNTSN